MAKETYYFSHDSNAITDTKILNMRADYGLEGYGLYWAIIEMMRNEEDYKLELSKNTYRAIKTLTNTAIDIEKYIKDCIEDYGLFREADNEFFSNSLLRRMTEYEKKREINKKNGMLGGRPKKTEIKPNGYEMKTEKNQNKIKESKEKENKINDTAVSDSCVDGLQEIIEFYNNNIGMITPFGLEILSDYAKEMQKDLIILAMKKAVEADIRTIQYIKGILNNWNKKGIKTVADAEKEDKQFKQNSKKEIKNKVQQRDYSEDDFNNLYANVGGK